jgi:hypothetical protein
MITVQGTPYPGEELLGFEAADSLRGGRTGGLRGSIPKWNPSVENEEKLLFSPLLSNIDGSLGRLLSPGLLAYY